MKPENLTLTCKSILIKAMKRNFLIGLLAVLIGVIGVTLVLASDHALVVHPKGPIAQSELELITINIILMLLIIVPTYIALFFVIWKYCIQKKGIKYDPEHTTGPIGEILMWGIPSLIVLVMAIVTWEATHRLNPYKPLESDTPPLVIEVIAMDWKWLFIYPEEGIATLNYLQIPEKRPIHFKLSADGTPMNSFWIPQLSGQIYSMTGMTTQLHLMADGVGNYTGRAVEINGEGYSDMTFKVQSASDSDFAAWIDKVRQSPLKLTLEAYNELVKPAVNKSVNLYSEFEEGLYDKILEKYMYPMSPVL